MWSEVFGWKVIRISRKSMWVDGIDNFVRFVVDGGFVRSGRDEVVCHLWGFA